MNVISNRVQLAVVVAVIALAAVAAGIGWGFATAGDRTEQTGAVSPPTTSTSPAGTTPDPGSTPAPGRTGGGGQAPDPPPAPPVPPAEAGPRVELFRVAQEPLCPRGTTQNPIEGRPLVLEWRVSGTDTVTLSIDGPGVYDTYPAEGGDTFSFACGGSEGDIERHTYLLTTTGAGQTVTEELVVEAVVHEITPV